MASKSIKNDHYVIWLKHLDQEFARRLERLAPEETIRLLINDQPTVWARMKPGGGRPTMGLKIVSGRPAWESIPRGSEFSIGVEERQDQHPQATAFPPARAKVDREQEPPLLRKENLSDSSTRGGSGRRGTPLFDAYEFADYSGAKDRHLQMRAIRLAQAQGRSEPVPFGRGLTRETLQTETLKRLEEATRKGVRMAFGRDHQYSIPIGLAREIGLDTTDWRASLRSLVTGAYGGPPLGHASTFASRFNDWMIGKGLPAYFYSHTKAQEYGLPSTNPRPSRPEKPDDTTHRLTELCRAKDTNSLPKPLNRVGDNGSVGGQTLVGLVQLDELLSELRRRGIPIAVWPFDGLDIRSEAYEGRHVLFEVYPTSIKPAGLKKSDWNDALASVLFVQGADQEGQLHEALDLGDLAGDRAACARFEGWIVGHVAEE